MHRSTNTLSRLAALTTLAGIAGLAPAQTDVPKGGAVIDLNAGSGQAVVEVVNGTGEDAYDLSVSIFHDNPDTPLPNIIGQDIVENDGNAEGDDVVDDDGDGQVDAGETDTNADDAGRNCKSILTNNGPVANGKTAKVAVRFDGDLPEGAKIRVKFSERIGDTHYDLCMTFPSPDEGVAIGLCTIGPAQMSYDYLNTTDQVIDVLAIPAFECPVPIIDLRLPDAYQHLPIFLDQDFYYVEGINLLPGQNLDLGLLFAEPVQFLWQECQFPIIGFPEPPCRADVNEDGIVDTRDYLEFLNLYNQRDPFADWNNDGLINTLDFLAFQNDWTDCR